MLFFAHVVAIVCLSPEVEHAEWIESTLKNASADVSDTLKKVCAPLD
jgi:hypothetical protein